MDRIPLGVGGSFWETGFAIRALRDMQLVLTRAFNDTLPTTPHLRRSY